MIRGPICIAAALVVVSTVLAVLIPALAADERQPEMRRVDLAELRDLARGTRADMQLKATWCGPQGKAIVTVVLGSYGHRLWLEKYVPLQSDGWGYGNDLPRDTRFFQIPPDAWRTILAGLADSPQAAHVNPQAPPTERRFHVIIAWTGGLESDIRYAEFFLGGDTPELRQLVADALPPEHPAHEFVGARLFRGF